jgi:hypothetical protein
MSSTRARRAMRESMTRKLHATHHARESSVRLVCVM